MKKRNSIVLSVLIVIAAVVAFYYFRNNKPQQIRFVTTKAKYGYIAKSSTATGTIQPVDTVSVGSQVSGVIKNIYTDFNQVVKKGQLIAKVDPSIIIAQVEVAKANLANAKSNLQFQQSTFDRQNKLFTLGAISKADFQLALNQKNTAEAAVKNTNALLSITNRNLFFTNIYSPIDGVVLNRNVSEGQTIATSFNAPTLFVIAKDLTKMQVRAAVDEADIGDVKSGQNVSFTVDAFPNDVFKGTVKEILLHAKTTANVVTYTTLINVDNSELKLKPGMTANINIYTEEDNHAFIIPSKALTFKPDSTASKKYILRMDKEINTDLNKKKFHKRDNMPKAKTGNPTFTKSYVWIKKGDTLTQKRITMSINDDVNVKIIDGLSDQDEIITNVLSGNMENNTGQSQRSPFMPQMGRRAH